ncbi:MAG: hypothetical protein D6705_06440 [Deltaproteobacteria bacterium]|nr:MAG: hypothetical protein D6705_06440 [Deltaproteobacteria bacterium]
MPRADNLHRLYRGLEALYGADSGLAPGAFLTTRPPSGRREMLYFRQGPDAFEISLGLDADLLARFEALAAERALRAIPFGDTLPVIEGLSHLLYVAEAARCERPFSGLELETQAEVDKLAVHALDRWPLDVDVFERLCGRLYEDFEFIDGLDEELRARYGLANRIARAFAATLAPLVRARRIEELRARLRAFWRAPLSGKVRLAETAVA